MTIIGDMANDAGNFVAALCTPASHYEDNLRKLSIWSGITGVVAAFALQAFAGMSATATYVTAGLSASLIVGGLTTIPIFSIVPVLALLGVTLASIDPNQIHFVYHLN